LEAQAISELPNREAMTLVNPHGGPIFWDPYLPKGPMDTLPVEPPNERF